MLQEEYYNVSDTEIDMVLLDIPLELMKENIITQIADVTIDVNYMEIISDKIKYLEDIYSDDPETIGKINNLIVDISAFMINAICDRFDFEFNIDTDAPKKVFELATSLYYCFILNFRKNVRRYLKTYIITHRKELADKFASKKKDVTTVSVKKKIKNREMAIIISNLPLVVRDIISVPPDVDTFFDSLSYYEANVVREYFETFELSGDMNTYFNILENEFDFLIDSITEDVKDKLIK